MKTWKKIGLGILFSGGLIVVVFATVRCALIASVSGYPLLLYATSINPDLTTLKDPENGAPVSGTWAVRETFVAIITANIPMAFTLVKGLLGPAFRSIRSTNHTENKPGSDRPTALDTFGSNSKQHRKSRGGHQVNPTLTNMLFTESEERIVYGADSPHLSGDTLRTSWDSAEGRDIEKQ